MALKLGAKLAWYGHSTFLIRTDAGADVLLDPWIWKPDRPAGAMNNPKCPEGFQPIEKLDAILLTHGHFDHIADTVDVFERYRPAAVVCNWEIGEWLKKQGLPEDAVLQMNKGGTAEVAGMSVTMVHAFHSSGIADGDRIVYGGEPAGYVLGLQSGKRIYCAGDTAVFSDMALIAELYPPDLALLPIGDLFTMGPREAAKACELLGVAAVVPIHWGTFPPLTGTPEALRQECAARGVEVDVVEVEPGAWVD
jgi:L-ascorbate metabolism protein UlaG (beta-lactamase superfamily)